MYAHYMQHSTTDCGIASLKTILKQLRIKIGNENELYQHYSIKKTQGLSLDEMKTILKKYGVNSSAYGVTDFEKLKKVEKLPMLLVVENDGVGHYIVVHEIKDNQSFIVSNPAERTLIEYDEAYLKSIFLGYALCIADSNSVVTNRSKKKFRMNKVESSLGKRLYKEVMQEISYSLKVKMIGLILLKYLLPIVTTFLIQGTLSLNRTDSAPMFVFVISVALLLILGFYKINIMEGKQKVTLENKIQEKILMKYYVQKVSDIKSGGNSDNVTGYFWNLFGSVSGLLEKFYFKLNLVYVLLLASIVFSITPLLFGVLVFWIGLFSYFLKRKIDIIRNNEKDVIGKSSAFSFSVENNIKSSFDINLFSKNKEAESFVQQKIQDYFESKNQMVTNDLKIASMFQVFSTLISISTFVVFGVNAALHTGSTTSLLNDSNGILIISIILSSVAPVLQSWLSYQKSAIAIDYIQSGEDYTEQAEKSEDVLDVPKITTIDVKNLNFSYDEKKTIFKQFDTRFEAGKLYTLIGDNGCGKSTLINLLSGVLDPDSGTMIVNESVEKSSFKNTNIREYISLYSPEFNLYGNTVGRNIRYKVFNEPLTTEEKSNYDDLLDLKLPNSYFIQSEGRNLSQGQKQKILLMRALYQDTSLYIFDEPTGNLDSASKKKFMNYIKKLANDEKKIVIVISHETDVLEYADEIINIKEKRRGDKNEK